MEVPGLYKADAQAVASEIAAISENATPAQILDKARDSSTELHKCFEWDDSAAAEKYRLDQARHIVRHLVIRETVREDKPPIRFFFKPEGGEGYKQSTIIVRNEDEYQRQLAQMFREAKSWMQRAKRFAELEEIVEAFAEAIKGRAS